MTREQLRDFLVIELARLLDSGRSDEIKTLLSATREFWLFLRDIPPIIWTNVPTSFRRRDVLFYGGQAVDKQAGQLSGEFGGDNFVERSLDVQDVPADHDEVLGGFMLLGEVDHAADAAQFGPQLAS
jgi:hypothetical protein